MIPGDYKPMGAGPGSKYGCRRLQTLWVQDLAQNYKPVDAGPEITNPDYKPMGAGLRFTNPMGAGPEITNSCRICL